MDYIFRAYQKDIDAIITHKQLMSYMYNHTYEYDVFNNNKFIIMLQTPYIDVNGKPIFEGDVIETKESKRQRFCYEVVRDIETGNFMAEPFMKGRAAIKFGYTTLNNLQDLKTIVDGDAQIIGNKYENIELYRRF